MRGQSVGEGEDGWCEGREGNNDCGQRVQVFFFGAARSLP